MERFAGGEKKLFVTSPEFLKITSKLRPTNNFNDARIILDDKSVYDVNKIVLAAGSSYFKALFTYNPTHDYHIRIVSKESLEQILNWMYKHHIKLGYDNIEEVLKDAHYLDCHEVVDECSKFVLKEVTPDNVIGCERYCRNYFLFDLRVKCWKYLTYHFLTVSKSDEFARLDFDDLMEILKCDDLNADEAVVFISAMGWINCDKPNRSKFFIPILRAIRLGQLPEKFFDTCVMSHPLVVESSGDTELQNLLADVNTFYESFKEYPWTPNPPFAQPRQSRDIILSIGGWSGGSACNLVESYDLRADRWYLMALQDPLGERGYLGAVTVGDKVYFVGGTNGERHFNGTSCLDVNTLQFEVLGPMGSARCYISVVSLDGYIYAIGGFDGTRRLATMERYSPESNQWMQMAKMKAVRSDAGAATWNGKIYVVGGFDGKSQLDTVESYNQKLNRWSSIPKMTTKRSGVSCAVVNGELYALGGYDGNTRLCTAEKFNFRSKKWLPVAEMRTGRSNFAVFVVAHCIYVIGGFDGETTTELVEKYDTKTNVWVKLTELQMHRSALAACVVEGQNLDTKTLAQFAYPNRHNLAEESREYEDDLAIWGLSQEDVSFTEDTNNSSDITFTSESGYDDNLSIPDPFDHLDFDDDSEESLDELVTDTDDSDEDDDRNPNVNEQMAG